MVRQLVAIRMVGKAASETAASSSRNGESPHFRNNQKAAHPAAYNAEWVRLLLKTKTPWDQEELYVMVSEPVRLIGRNITGRTNETLTNLLNGSRTLEAVKSCRAQPQYKAVLKTVMEASVLGSPSIPLALNVTQRVHPVVAAAA